MSIVLVKISSNFSTLDIKFFYMRKLFILVLVISLCGIVNSSAKENITNPNRSTNHYRILAQGCAASSAQTALNINNVRTLILGAGDMWWD